MSFLESEKLDLRKGVFFLAKTCGKFDFSLSNKKQGSKIFGGGGLFIFGKNIGHQERSRGISRGLTRGKPP